jgi:hypothetical protein
MLGVFSVIKFYLRNTHVERATHRYTGDVPKDPTDVVPSSLRTSWGASSPSEVVPPEGAGTESGDNDATEPRLDEIPLRSESETPSRSVSSVLQRANT